MFGLLRKDLNLHQTRVQMTKEQQGRSRAKASDSERGQMSPRFTYHICLDNIERQANGLCI